MIGTVSNNRQKQNLSVSKKNNEEDSAAKDRVTISSEILNGKEEVKKG